jgi:hypothetical protein
MTLRIYKYKLHPDTDGVYMPKGAQVLYAREQGDDICVWALVDIDDPAPSEPRRFSVYGTGHEIRLSDPGRYVGSAHLQNGALVFHVFEWR